MTRDTNPRLRGHVDRQEEITQPIHAMEVTKDILPAVDEERMQEAIANFRMLRGAYIHEATGKEIVPRVVDDSKYRKRISDRLKRAWQEIATSESSEELQKIKKQLEEKKWKDAVPDLKYVTSSGDQREILGTAFLTLVDIKLGIT